MAAEVTQRDLRSRSGQIMDAVSRGESFVVTRSGTPIGELIPLRRYRAISREQFAAASIHAPEIDLDQFQRDADAVMNREFQDPYDD